MLRSKKGYTLIELLVCVFIILILAAFVIPPIAGFLTREPSAQNVQVMTQEEEAALKKLPQEEKSTDKGRNKQL